MREQPISLLEKLQKCVMNHDTIVISAITYSKMRFGAIGKKASVWLMLSVNALTRFWHGIKRR